MTRFVPVLPADAPFTAEQRAYLNGFLAGLFSHTPIPAPGTPTPAPAPALAPLTIAFGSQTGNAERLAKRIAKLAGQRGFAPTVHDLASYSPAQLAADPAVLLVVSTYGDGEPPDNARAFWQSLAAETAPRCERTRIAVCALGDSNYPRFCQFGRDLDARLASLGASRLVPRQDCDVDFEREFQSWLEAALAALAALVPPNASTAPVPPPNSLSLPPALADALASTPDPEQADASPYSRSNPYPALLKTNRPLGAPGSAKDVRHFELDLAGSGLTYEVGDALGVWPTQCPELVRALLDALGCDGEEAVPGRDGSTIPLRLALLHHYELGRLTPALLAHFARHTGDPVLQRVTAPDANGELQAYTHGRDLLDLLLDHPQVRPDPAAFVGLLRKLQPRLYSISSSPKAHPGEVHLTVNAVRYQSLQRDRRGVASCFLADRAAPPATIPVFVHANPSFRPPAPDVPLIMIGPGTGIAPFRAFLEERRALGATGPNWLFFGDQHAATDFLYRDELETFARDGLLTRLDLAWSRDQSEKIYVQHRLLEAARELWDWLERGAALYVCGDASRMARDVESALHRVIQEAGARSPDQAAEYLRHLQSQSRYRRDIY